MKIYEIRNKDTIYGYLFSDDNYEEYYIDLVDGLDSYPVFFDLFIKKRKTTINSYWSKKWVMERVIPYERQNINDILKESKIKYYNELLLFVKCGGKSSMDDNYLKEINDKDIAKERNDRVIKDFIRISNNKLIVFFKNETVVLDYLEPINEIPFLSKLSNEIIFNSKYRFDYEMIKKNGKRIDFRYEDLVNYINENIYSAKEVEDELGISKQSVYNLRSNESVIKLNNNMFLKNNIKTLK